MSSQIKFNPSQQCYSEAASLLALPNNVPLVQHASSLVMAARDAKDRFNALPPVLTDTTSLTPEVIYNPMRDQMLPEAAKLTAAQSKEANMAQHQRHVKNRVIQVLTLGGLFVGGGLLPAGLIAALGTAAGVLTFFPVALLLIALAAYICVHATGKKTEYETAARLIQKFEKQNVREFERKHVPTACAIVHTATILTTQAGMQRPN